MKSSDLLLVAGAALAVFMFYKYMQNAPAADGTASATPSTGNGWASLMQTWQGWQYFSDGTVIGPDGKYYSDGVVVYTP